MRPLGFGHLGLKGHLHLVCDRAHDDSSYLREKSFAVPLHVSKPYWDGNCLLVNLVSPTAGMLEGDHVDCEVQVEPGASLVLSAPAATRVHTMQGGGTAKLTQQFLVHAGGFLEYNPEPLILQRGSTFCQNTRIELESGSEMLFLENLLSGRVTFGEAFAFDSFRNRLEIIQNGALVALENYTLASGSPTLRDWQSAFPKASYGSFYSFSPQWQDQMPPVQEIEAHQNADVLVGMSKIADCGWIVRILAESPIHLRRTIVSVREILLRGMGRSVTDLRRY